MTNMPQDTLNPVSPTPPIKILKRNGRDTFSTVQMNNEVQPEHPCESLGYQQENVFGPMNYHIGGWSNGNAQGNILS